MKCDLYANDKHSLNGNDLEKQRSQFSQQISEIFFSKHILRGRCAFVLPDYQLKISTRNLSTTLADFCNCVHDNK